VSARDPDWLGAARGAVEALRGTLTAAPTTAERARETGTRGEGGDRTLEIDAAAEAAVFRRLEALHAEGHRFVAISEERGRVDFGFDPEAPLLVVIDPLDGSRNAKRGLTHHALSLAVADGPTMADVVFGFVHDFGPGEEWTARRGQGAWCNGVRLDPDVPERRVGGRLELVGLESAGSGRVRDAAAALAATCHHVRALGATAVTLCQVAAGRLDGMVTLRRSRAVDVAAGQLVVREGGGVVRFTESAGPLAAPVDALEPVSLVVAARSEAAADALAAVVRPR